VAAIPFGDGDGDRAFLATGSWFIPGFERYEPTAPEAWADLRDRVAELLDVRVRRRRVLALGSSRSRIDIPKKGP